MPIGLDKIPERLCRDRRGVSALEFAIVAPVMAMLLFGAYDFSNAAQQQIQLQEAVRAGGAYAISRPTDVTGIQNAVAGALPGGRQLVGGVAAVSCSCMDPGSGALSALPGCLATDLDSCSATSAKAISITATTTYTALTPLFAAAIPDNSATYVVRFQ